mgnify:CR=1 FL=1
MNSVCKSLWMLAWSVAVGAASAQTLRVGLAEDPDVLDPTMARTFVGRIVFSALCDKLLENMSRDEWRQWVDPNIPYVTLCPSLPTPL